VGSRSAEAGPEKRFEFGANWQDFAARGLDERSYQEADRHIRALRELAPDAKSFLDVGCGSGLFLLAALQHGFSPAVGFDYDPNSVAATSGLLADAGMGDQARVERGDVLDTPYLETLGTFDVVYAWGSLHHTGDMWQAIENAAGRVAPGGLFVIAIYNRTWSSPAWNAIKRFYVHASPTVQKALVGATWVVGATARALYTRTSPFKQRRGMSFYHNMVDWVGGYPYEYATVDEIVAGCSRLGLMLMSSESGPTPIACNEFIFRR
jgi:2-polyprenyl-6-hydroxyphenyl methylase/3-demethylubiquinone-9 3-methyltransferase